MKATLMYVLTAFEWGRNIAEWFVLYEREMYASWMSEIEMKPLQCFVMLNTL